MEKQIKQQIRKNAFNAKYGIDRKEFRCLELNIPTKGEWMLGIIEKAEKIEGKLNAGQANTLEERDAETVKIDNLSGVIAEYACDAILRLYLGKENVVKPASGSSNNQIDIALKNGKKNNRSSIFLRKKWNRFCAFCFAGA